MNGISKDQTTTTRATPIVLLALLALSCSAQLQAADTSMKLLETEELDHVSAGAASSSVRAHAGGLGSQTHARTGSNVRVYVREGRHGSLNIATGTGWASAGGTTSVATVEMNSTVSGNLSVNHQVSHSANSAKSGSSYASGYTLLVSH